MRVYCNESIVLATHDDAQIVDPALYGVGVDVVIVPDGYEFQPFGELPDGWEPGDPDIRPMARPELALSEVKAQIKRAIDDAAELERLKYITAGAGQAMTYQRKVEEARRLQAAIAAEEEIVPGDYPLLSASLGIDGETLADVAGVVLGMDAAWAQIGAAIETARLAGKKAVDDAGDEAAARAVVVAWPQPGG